jgi:HSP20 family protein
MVYFFKYLKIKAMANLSRRNEGRAMDPWRNIFDIDFFGSRFPQGGTSLPAVNISEDDKSYTVELVSPGFKKEDFKIKVDDDVLTISAETKKESTEGSSKEYSRREYSYNSFTRSFRLPENAKDNEISARYNDGILEIQIPKSNTQVKATKEISVQ